MATYQPPSRLARVAVYIETEDGQKMLYDYQDVEELITNTEQKYDAGFPWDAHRIPRPTRTDITFELRNVGPYTVYKPRPGENPFQQAPAPAIEPPTPEIETP